MSGHELRSAARPNGARLGWGCTMLSCAKALAFKMVGGWLRNSKPGQGRAAAGGRTSAEFLHAPYPMVGGRTPVGCSHSFVANMQLSHRIRILVA